MTDQPEALRWAAILEHQAHCDGPLDYKHKAARLLREQHAEIERLRAQRDALLKVLKDVLPVAEDAAESLGRFCGDEGWAQEDMDRMDNVDGMLPLMRAAIDAAAAIRARGET